MSGFHKQKKHEISIALYFYQSVNRLVLHPNYQENIDYTKACHLQLKWPTVRNGKHQIYMSYQFQQYVRGAHWPNG